MIKIIDNPSATELDRLLARPFSNDKKVVEIAQQIIDDVRSGGDSSVRAITLATDKVDLESFVVSQQEIAEATEMISDSLKEAIAIAKTNIESFHSAQKMADIAVETAPGVVCSQKSKPITRVGLYIPGGTAPLFSTVLMLAAPAKIAGCREVVMCTPPSKDGSVAAEILYAANLCGVDKIYKIGGATAVAAMACGTETIKPVYKIFGPGNRYVTAAKQLVMTQQTAIDIPAGPSEVMVVCDESASPRFVAADMLSQAEHGADSQSIAVVTSMALALEIKREIGEMLKVLPRSEYLLSSLESSSIVVVRSIEELIDTINDYAPEHLIIAMEQSDKIAEMVENAGSVFIGHYTPESAGDYCSGTNHTLPTGGWGKSLSGVNLDSFCKKITYQKISREGMEGLAQTIITMAQAEGLEAHALAAKVRIEKL